VESKDCDENKGFELRSFVIVCVLVDVTGSDEDTLEGLTLCFATVDA